MYNVIQGLEGQLESAQSGTGPDGTAWYIPPPPYGATTAQLQYTIDKLMDFKSNITGVISAGGASRSTIQNGIQMIAIFDQRIAEYKLAMANSTPLPTMPVEDDTFPAPTDTTIPPAPTDTAEKSNMPVILIGAGLVGLFIYAQSRKKKVSGKNDNVLPVVIGIGALLLLIKKKDTPPVVLVESGAIPEPDFIYEQSTFLR